ncbi:MAG: carboxymuconolactone decarboxylase family protein [Opitutae bacterium]|nr:carboxymuconolactone decarboxylase family protein [Opitutae bacterium]
MTLFTKHDAVTAPEAAAQVLGKVNERYGFIPNLAAYVAESPTTLAAVLDLTSAFERTTLSVREQQIVLLTVSRFNQCQYCQTVHVALARKSGVDADTIRAVLAAAPLPGIRENALRNFVHALVDSKGWVKVDEVETFLAAGFTRAHVFECIVGVTLKTLTNYCNHVAGAVPNPEFVAMAGDISV